VCGCCCHTVAVQWRLLQLLWEGVLVVWVLPVLVVLLVLVLLEVPTTITQQCRRGRHSTRLEHPPTSHCTCPTRTAAMKRCPSLLGWMAVELDGNTMLLLLPSSHCTERTPRRSMLWLMRRVWEPVGLVRSTTTHPTSTTAPLLPTVVPHGVEELSIQPQERCEPGPCTMAWLLRERRPLKSPSNGSSCPASLPLFRLRLMGGVDTAHASYK